MRSVVLCAALGAILLSASGATAETAAEQALARRVSSHLKDSGQLRNYRIGVTYQDGICTLSGTVASDQQRDKAIRLAEQVSGVSRVVSNLEIPGNGGFAGGESRSLSTAFDAKPASGSDQHSPVVNAYGTTERAPRLARTTSPGAARGRQMPMPMGRGMQHQAVQQASAQGVYPAGGGYCPPGGGMGGPMMGGAMPGGPMMGGGAAGVAPVGFVPHAHGRGPSYENPQMPGYAWPSYASYPNYAALTYPRQYSPTAWPYIGPFYPYPQVPLAWRKVSLEWDDGWWFLDFSAHNSSH